MPEAKLRERHGERIERAARRLFQDIGGGRAAQPSFLSLMVFRIRGALRRHHNCQRPEGAGHISIHRKKALG